jgi:hypothetical protein
MSTTADRITDDLAMLGRTSRERPTQLDVTLRAVGAAPSTAATELTLLPFARVFAARVARAAAGTASLACLVMMLVWLAVPRDAGQIERARLDRSLSIELLEGPRHWLGLLVLCACLAVHVATSAISARVFERLLARARDPLEAARRLTRQADPLATAASITGIATFILGFGMLEVVVGDLGLIVLFSRGDMIGSDTVASIHQVMLVSLGAAFIATTAGAIAVGRNLGVLRRTGWMIVCGTLLGLVTFILGVRFDAGPLFQTITGSAQPFVAVRLALTAVGTIAVFLTTTGVVLWMQRRGQASRGDR